MHVLRRLFLLLSLSLVFAAIPLPVYAQAQQLAPATITEVLVTTVDGKAVKDTALMAGRDLPGQLCHRGRRGPQRKGRS